MTAITTVGVIGSGAWGTALAVAANRAGSNVTLWSRNEAIAESLREYRLNDRYLPGVFIDPDIVVTTDLQDIRHCHFLILAVPAQQLRMVAITLSDIIDVTTPLVLACKGVEQTSLMLMHEVMQTILPKNPLLALSGPNFAIEVANGLPTATTIASHDEKVADQFIYAIGGKLFRPYYTDDLVATEIAGAVKNVIAIACGIAAGRGYGENAKAALMTRGLAEMMRLSEVKGGRRDSMMGLAGVGDLVLTCSSTKSRNYSYGLRLGKGEFSMNDDVELLTEGVTTAESVTELAKVMNVSMPLCTAVHHIISNPQQVDSTIKALLERPFVMDVERSSI